jgi:hypothetical protein
MLAVAVGALIGCGSAIAATTPRALIPSYLFSIPTASGSLTGPNDKHLTLRLTGTRDYLTRFTDSPLRQATVVANVDFARRFKTYFAASAPNAVLTYTPRGAQIPVSIVLTITAPHWNPKRSTWTFRATRIRKRSDTLPGSIHITPPLIPNPRTFGHATLLIDGSSAQVGNPIELTGDGIAGSLSGFLQHLFATTLAGTVGDTLSMDLGVEYSYALTAKSTVVMPVLQTVDTAFHPTIDVLARPKSVLCQIEQMTRTWQGNLDPSTVDGAYIFNLTLSSSPGQELYTETLNYPLSSGGLVSAACSG